MWCIEKIICIFNNILQKISSKNPFFEKVKMTTKKTLVLESIVIVGSFDCGHTIWLVLNKTWLAFFPCNN
jgi:hypothetical protein